MTVFHGLIPILATPFDEAGELDLPSLRRLVEFELAAGVDGLAVFGMASEGFALTAAERRAILNEVLTVAQGHVPVIAGVNGTSTVTSIEQAQEAQEGGAAGLMVLPPFMVKPPTGTLVEFYGDVAASTALPLMVQDAPNVTGVAMPPSLIAQLSELKGIESVKVEAPPTAPKVSAVVAEVDDGFAVLGGQNAQFCLDEYSRGAVGTMPACEFSDLLQPVLQDWTNGDRAIARRAFERLLPLILIGLQSGIAWAVHKEVLLARGIIEHATVRHPSGKLDAPSLEAVRTVLDDLDLRHENARVSP